MIDELFEAWITADNSIYEIKETIKALEKDLFMAQTNASEAMVKVRDYMQHNGVMEDNVKGSVVDYKIYYTTPRQSVKVADASAVPDEFCKIERVPELKKIKEFLDNNDNIPNWASIEFGEPKLTYKVVKRK